MISFSIVKLKFMVVFYVYRRDAAPDLYGHGAVCSFYIQFFKFQRFSD